MRALPFTDAEIDLIADALKSHADSLTRAKFEFRRLNLHVSAADAEAESTRSRDLQKQVRSRWTKAVLGGAR
jgi:hypothetical protein